MGQPVLGLLMLDMRFPRPPGDIGNPRSFDVPVIQRRVKGADVGSVVFDAALPAHVKRRFVEEARALERDGATIIATSCGFLAPIQTELAAAVNVPLITSALWLLPHLRMMYGTDTALGILTYDSRSLSKKHIPDPGPYDVAGLENGRELHQVIAGDQATLDIAAAEMDAVAAARQLVGRSRGIKALLLECTNLPPYRDAIARAVDRPVYDVCDLLNWHLRR